MSEASPRLAPLLLIPGGLALLAGLDAALTLSGARAGSPRLADLHGPLMVLAFLGTVIALERAVALRQAWARRATRRAIASKPQAMPSSTTA